MHIKTILLISCLIISGTLGFLPTVYSDNPLEDNWVIDGDTVYIDDSLVYASATPHTVMGNTWVEFNFRSKAYSGDVDFVWGFDVSTVKPVAVEIWKNYTHYYTGVRDVEKYGSITLENVTDYTSLGIENYDSYDVTLGNANNIYLFNVSYNYNIGNGSYVTGIYAFSSYDVDGDDYTLSGYYDAKEEYEYTEDFWDWKVWDADFNKINYEHGGMNTWYLLSGIPIVSGVDYKIRARIQTPISLNGNSGKYWWAFKPSSETLGESIGNNHFYCLDPWWNSNWDYYKQITLDSIDQVPSTLTNFPVLINLSSDAGLASHAQSDGGDIAFVLASDNTTQYPHEIEQFDSSTGKLVAWVNISSLPHDSDLTINMYYGNAGASNQTDIDNVWNSDFIAVYHMNSTTTQLFDSTKNRHGTKDDVNDPVQAEGWVGYGQDFDASNTEKVTATKLGAILDVTVEAWYKPGNTKGDLEEIVSNTFEGDEIDGKSFTFWRHTDGKLRWGVHTDSAQMCGFYSSTVLLKDKMYYCVGVFNDETYGRSYIDGALEGTDDTVTGDMGNQANAELVIGSEKASTGYRLYSDGIIDEVRVSKTPRDINWIQCTYNVFNNGSTSCANPFIQSIGSEQSESTPSSNNNPSQSGESPTNSTTGIGITPSLYVVCSDNDGDTMNASWWSNSSGSWVQFASNETSFANNTNITQGFTNATSYSTMYWWSVNLSDGMGGYNNETYHFTTIVNSAPVFSNPHPSNNSVGENLSFTWNITINDPDGNTFNWSIECGNGDTSSANGASNGSKSLAISGLSYSTGYTVWVNCTDSYEWTNETFAFTTWNLDNPVGTINTTTGLSSTSTDLHGYLSEDGNDSDGCWVRFQYCLNNTNFDGEGTSTAWQKDKVSGTEINQNIGALAYGSLYYVRMQINNSAGWYNTTNSSFMIKPPDSSIISGYYNNFNGTLRIWEDEGIKVWYNIANYTVLRYGTADFPSSITDGTEIFNDTLKYNTTTETYFYTTSVVPYNTTLYLSSWNVVTWSNPNHFQISDSEKSKIHTPIEHQNRILTDDVTKVENNSVTFNLNLSEDGSLDNWVNFEYGTDNSYSSNTTNQTGFTEGTYSEGVTGLTPGQLYFVRARANNTNVTNRGDDPYKRWVFSCSGTSGVNQLIYLPEYIFSYNSTIESSSVGSNIFASISDSMKCYYYDPVTDGYKYWVDAGDDADIAFTYNTDYLCNFTTNQNLTINLDEVIFLTRPSNTSNINSVNGSNYVNVSWTSGDGSNATVVIRKTGSYPTSVTDGTEVYNGTLSYYNDTDIEDKYYYRIWSWSNWSYSGTEYAQWSSGYSSVTGEPSNTYPVFSGETPSNNSVSVDITQSIVNVTINDADGHTFNWTIQVSNDDNDSADGASNGSKSVTLTTPLDYDTSYTWWVNCTDGYGWTNESYVFTTRSEYIPSPPSGFSATAKNRTVINLAWTNNGSNNTIIEYNTSSSWTRGDGTELDNSTNTTYTHSGLSFGTTYYYQAWSYNSTDVVYSTTNSSDNAITSSNSAPSFSGENPSNNSVGNSLSFTWNITINDADGDTFNWSIECGNGDTNSANDEGNGSKSLSISGLSYSTGYTVWVNCTDGYNWTNETFFFTTKHNSAPSFSGENPANNSVDQSTAFTWNITINDAEGHTFNWTIECGNGDTSSANGASNGSKSLAISGLDWSTTYTVWVNCTDGYNWTNETFFFTTKANNVPVFSGENPSNNSVSVDITQSTVNVTINDPDGHTFNWTIEVSSGDSDSANGASNGSKSVTLTNPLDYSTAFTWWVNCTDSYNWTNASYTFTTRAIQEPLLPTNIFVNTSTDTTLLLTWTKGINATHTYIERNTSSIWSKGNGTLVYNSTGTTYTNTGLKASTNYTYRFWSYNSTDNVFNSSNSSGYNWTRPQAPQNVTVDVNGASLEFDWDNGTGCDTTLIVQKTSSYPANETDGTVIYNSSLSNYTKPMFNSSDRFTLFTYNSTSNLYSSGTDGEWGLLTIYVYKEDEPHIQIGNYTVFITNSDASETYQATLQSNPVELNVDDVPNGDDITIQISKDGYKTRSQIYDLAVNEQYNISFYLAADSSGSPSGESDEDWYVNGSDPDNETFASHYIITVEDNVDEPVEDAYVVIKRYINTTDSYENVTSDYSDSSGQVEVDLIPDTVYYVTISKTNYNTMNTFWTPSEISYVEDAYKTFIITPVDTSYSNATSYGECIVFTGEKGGSYGFVNLSNSGTSCGSMVNFSIWVYEINLSSNTTVYYDSYNETGGNQSYDMTFVMNTSNNYYVRVFMNHSVFGELWNSLYIVNYESPGHTSVDEFDSLFDNIFGDSSIGWSGLAGLFILLGGLFAFGQRGAGLSLVIVGFVMLGINTGLGLVLLDASICILIILVGILLQWKIERSVKG